ncbi:YncE family protein [Priestia megaterium]|uniref:YncE family protein n=1 Tax=Priestia megaterium TaxID=1404 RepID=UPI0023789634|nr:hypothetical protein [Priestia megaterium]
MGIQITSDLCNKWGSQTVSVIDGATNTVIAIIPVGVQPAGVGINPYINRIYISNRGSNTVSVIGWVN